MIRSVALSDDGTKLITGNGYGIVTYRDLEKGAIEHHPLHTKAETGEQFEEVTTVSFSEDGKWVAAGGWSKRITAWELESEDYLFWEFDDWVSDIHFAPGYEHIFASLWSPYLEKLPLTD